MKTIDAGTQHFSGKLDYLRIHRPNAAQRVMNRLLPDSMKILGRVVHETRDIGNLILNDAMIGNFGGPPAVMVGTSNVTFNAMTSTVPNYTDPDGTYSQTGTVVTRQTGTGVFAAGDVGKEIKFGTGERCHITVFTNTTTVTVSKSQTVAATTLRRYDGCILSSTTGFSQQKSSATPAAPVYDYTAGTAIKSWTTVFDSNPTAYTLGSIIISSVSRIVLPVPVSVAQFDQVSLGYTLQIAVSTRATRTISLSDAIAGYPVEYPIATMSGNGSVVTLVTSTAHHFLNGDAVVVNNAVPLRKAVTSAASAAGTWTITATGHGYVGGESVVHAGFSASGYNGTYVVASVTNANVYTVTNGATPGASTGGTTRLDTPAGYFDGSYTVASVPNSTTVTFTSTKTGPAIDTAARLTSPNTADMTVYGTVFNFIGSASWQGFAFNETNQKATPAISTQTMIVTTGNSFTATSTGPTFTAPGYANDFTATAVPLSAQAWSAGGSTENRVKQLHLNLNSTSGFFQLITFTTAQPKLSTHRLALPGWRTQLMRDLP